MSPRTVAIQLLGVDGPMSGGRLMLLGGPDDGQVIRSLKGVVPDDRLINIAGKVDLLTAYACLKRARLFIGNDSGLMHMAAAAGTPTIGLFTVTDDSPRPAATTDPNPESDESQAGQASNTRADGTTPASDTPAISPEAVPNR